MAARELPHLAITTQAYGIRATGQINQIPFYDEYARHMNPKLVALVFYINDFADNSTALKSLALGADPDRMPYMSAQRDSRGAFKLRPPHPEYERFLLPKFPQPWRSKARQRLVKVSYFAKWLDINSPAVMDRVNAILARIRTSAGTDTPQASVWMNIIAERPCCASLLYDWQPVIQPYYLIDPFLNEHLPPVFEEALEYTAFGIDQFKQRTDRDGVKLAIVATTNKMGTQGDPQFDRLNAIAEPRGIPVISQYDYIARQEYAAEDGLWSSGGHWNAAGHQWMAEAVLEWLKENQEVCD